MIIRLAHVIPASEAWLYENPAALSMVRSGLKQSKAGETAPSPDLKSDAKLADHLEDLQPIFTKSASAKRKARGM